jgi:hypothetical protein
MKWQPWDDFRPEPQDALPIPAPPCPSCVHWNPVRKFEADGVYGGVKLCHATDMFSDFSCFKEKAAVTV